MSTNDPPTPSRTAPDPAPAGAPGTMPASPPGTASGTVPGQSLGAPQANTATHIEARQRQARAHRQRYFASLPLHLTLTVIGFALFVPFLWMVLTSLKPLDQVGLQTWLPQLSASTDRGQFPDQQVQQIREQVRNAQTPAEQHLSQAVDLDALTLTPAQLTEQINGVIQSPDPVPDAVYQSVEASPQTRTFREAMLEDQQSAVDATLTGAELEEAENLRRRNVSMYNAWLLHDAVPNIIPEPSTFRWHNYLEVFRQIPFGRYYLNSLFVACWVTFLQVLTSSLAAFSFARLQWPGRDKVFLLYLSTMMLPGLVMMIPNYQIMITLGLVDTIAGLILPAAFTAFGTFLLRQFMLSIPASLDEAAEIDGAGKWRTFWDVILPLARPGLVTLAIFTFMGNYNSFFWPLVMIRSEHRYTLPIGLLYFDSSAGQETNLLMAAVTMSVVPMILVFVVMQKQLVKGIQLGAVKG